MKKIFLILFIGLVSVFLVCTKSNNKKDKNNKQIIKSIKKTAETNFGKTIIVNVDNLVDNPSSFKGKIAIKGAVSIVKPEQSFFTIIDLREYEKCGAVSCSIKQLPIKYSGIKAPLVGDKIIVYGSIEKNNNRYSFIFEKMEKIQ